MSQQIKELSSRHIQKNFFDAFLFLSLSAATVIFLFAGFFLSGLSARAASVTLSLNITDSFLEKTFGSASASTTSLTTTDGHTVELDFPTDFVGEDYVLQLSAYASDFFETAHPAPSGKSFIGMVFDIDFSAVIGGTSISSTDKSATITISFDDNELGDLIESTVTPYTKDSGDSEWTAISGATLDTDANTVTFNASSFSFFSLFGASSLPSSPAPSPSPSGGGGGGGGGIIQPTAVIFRGKVSPFAELILLKDAAIKKTGTADKDGTFDIRMSDITAGMHTFGLVGIDASRVSTGLSTITANITGGVTTVVSGIFLPPTIHIDKSNVLYGEPLEFSGQSIPNAHVFLFLNNEKSAAMETDADGKGMWSYQLNTMGMKNKSYVVRARAVYGNEMSSYSTTMRFAVGNGKSIPAPATRAPDRGDMNNDARVNLSDFSIMAYWYSRQEPLPETDLNNDGKVTLTDFSILAFYWTG